MTTPSRPQLRRGKPSRWLTVAIADVPRWPDVEYLARYDGFEFHILPETNNAPPAIALEIVPPVTNENARAAIRRFLSAYAWVEKHSARDDFGVISGNRGGLGKPANRPPVPIVPHFYLDYMPSTANPKARLCLALYREALCLNNPAYKFLAFFKIINVLHEKGAAQKKWITATLLNLTDHQAQARLAELMKAQPNIAHYLYESGRCAVAHAYNQPIADPDEPEDTERLYADLPVIQALAECLIEHDLGIKSSATIWREHLYELEGFRSLFGEKVVARLKAKEHVVVSDLPALPLLTVQVRERLPYLSFQEMAPEIVGVKDGVMGLRLTTTPPVGSLYFELDFIDERLRFDPLQSIEMGDDGSLDAAKIALDAHRLWRDTFGNRVPEIWSSGSDSPLGRTEPYIPRNMRYNHDAWMAQHAQRFRLYLLRLGGATEPIPLQPSGPA
jgi:hypothetical protein